MKPAFLALLTVIVLAPAAHLAFAGDAPATAPAATQAAVVDLKNTICVVAGDTIDQENKGDPITATYEGKMYHFCCRDCLASFKKHPEKYAKAAAENPAKYGIKS